MIHPFECHISTAKHQHSQIKIHFINRSVPKKGKKDSDTIELIEIWRAGRKSMEIKDFSAVLYGWTGSYNSHQYPRGMNEIICCGDFVFIAQVIGRSWQDAVENEKMTALYLIDNTKPNMTINLNQMSDYGRPRPEFPNPPVQLIQKGEGISMPRGLETNAYRYFNTLFEISITGNHYLFSEHGIYRDGEYQLNAPQKFDSCNGAARIHYKENTFRWIFADTNGLYCWADLQERLENTTHVDDWNTLKQNHIQGATRKELTRLKEHFTNLYSLSLIEEKVFLSIESTLSPLLGS